ncbi:hypothetical protein JKP88DRAFT_286073 [Tribonema minus]|uniref:Uncharacterized protein n=1 Tax=Tribonema minus TaxID=303371 RepID=A0A836CLZ2_9STRA|nr:hypothetical protein JKP88DRAFT_286073 [Tribonema minus]
MKCDVPAALVYSRGSRVDIYFNYGALVLTTAALQLSLRGAGDVAARAPRCARAAWLPVTALLLALQVFADCAADEQASRRAMCGISAIWAAHAGWLATALVILHPLFDGAPAARAAAAAAIAAAAALTAYYAVAEPPLTTVAHIVAAGVGALLAVAHKHIFGVAQPYEGLCPAAAAIVDAAAVVGAAAAAAAAAAAVGAAAAAGAAVAVAGARVRALRVLPCCCRPAFDGGLCLSAVMARGAFRFSID